MKDSTRKWTFTLIVGLILWSFLFFMRIYWYQPWCATTPSPCIIDQVNILDRLVFLFGSKEADFWSNVVQNFTGMVAFIVPWALFKKEAALEETLITASTSFWNLAILEVVRAIVQRPRPLVFNNVMGDGANIHQYTSFYSGHTSFVALASLSFFFILKRRLPHLSWRAQSLILTACFGVTALTGILRVWGGRHYPTDVLAAILFGTSIALYFRRKHFLN
jgi:membrane-associated phospholipid phosphatase